MNYSKPQFVRAAQLSALIMMFFGQVTGSASIAADSQRNRVLHTPPPLSKLAAKSVPISEVDAKAIETWLMGNPSRLGLIFGTEPNLRERINVVSAQPNARSELAKIVTRQDLPYRLRIYAQQILLEDIHQVLLESGHSTSPIPAEAYCQAIQKPDRGLYHDEWGLPGEWINSFGKTLVSYGYKALPCLSQLLKDNNELRYVSSEVGGASGFMQYRVSDLAAYFITQILHLPYNSNPNPAVRDQSIQALRQRLTTSLQGAGEAQCSFVKQK